ncbi:MAG: hypothetical protein ACTSWI_07220 [Alphaproteobacteria bacterium]
MPETNRRRPGLPEIVDVFARLKFPERYQAFERLASELIGEAIGERSIVELQAQLRSRKRAAVTSKISEQDLEDLGLSVDNLISDQESRSARVRAGSESPHIDLVLKIVAGAFLAAEKANTSFAEAVSCALDELTAKIAGENNIPSERTIQNWLRAIIRVKLTSIPAPQRGRPKKYIVGR